MQTATYITKVINFALAHIHKIHTWQLVTRKYIIPVLVCFYLHDREGNFDDDDDLKEKKT